MAFKFPNVYDAMYAKSVIKNAIPGITKEDYNKGIKEATFLALRSTVPYTIETFTNKDDIFQGRFLLYGRLQRMNLKYELIFFLNVDKYFI